MEQICAFPYHKIIRVSMRMMQITLGNPAKSAVNPIDKPDWVHLNLTSSANRVSVARKKETLMGLLKGAVTFSRYRIAGALPDHFPDFFNERIRRYAFQTVWRTTDEMAAGWTSLENCLDTDFPYASYAQGRYMLFSLRIDRKSVAPSLLRLRILEAERKQLAESGQKKLYREQREAIRESVRLESARQNSARPLLS